MDVLDGVYLLILLVLNSPQDLSPLLPDWGDAPLHVVPADHFVRATRLPALYDPRGMEGRVMALVVDELARLPPQPLGLRMPRDPRLLRLCELLLHGLDAPARIAKLGAQVGLSERSVIRLFPRETGLSFRGWHNQARLIKAFELFGQGRSVSQAAFEVGYSSPGAFAKMFRRAMGKAPVAMGVTRPAS